MGKWKRKMGHGCFIYLLHVYGLTFKCLLLSLERWTGILYDSKVETLEWDPLTNRLFPPAVFSITVCMKLWFRKVSHLN